VHQTGNQTRERAIQRGIRFIYNSACDEKSFTSYEFDYLSCFSLISSTSGDPGLRRVAREMGRERARLWRKQYSALPSNAETTTIMKLIDASISSDKLGVRDGALNGQIRDAAKRFTVHDFLGFDPALEAPPPGVPRICRCGVRNPLGRKTCQKCKRRLQIQNRYETWMHALYKGYRAARSGVLVGARYEDAIKWLPAMRPYCARSLEDDEDFYYCVYAITHLVYTLNDYGRFKLSPRWLPHEFQFLKDNLVEAIELDDPDMVGEFLDTLKAFGLTGRHPLIRMATDYLLSSQNTDGSWGDAGAKDSSDCCHPTWAAIDGLRDYAWRGQRLSFPKLKPLLEHLAR
jgi:hypothetical protein